MWRDPIVEEVRRIRREIEAEFDNDPQKYYEHILKVQQEYKERLVRRRPRTLKTPVQPIKNMHGFLEGFDTDVPREKDRS